MALVVVAAVVVVIVVVVVVVVVIVIIAIRVVVVAVVVAISAQATLLPSRAFRPCYCHVAPCFTRGAAHCAFLTAARPADNADQVARAAWGSGSGWGS